MSGLMECAAVAAAVAGAVSEARTRYERQRLKREMVLEEELKRKE